MFQDITNEKLLGKVDNLYCLAVLASKRARDLMYGAKRLVEIKSNKPTVIAINEIYEGKVTIKKAEEVLQLSDILSGTKNNLNIVEK